MRRQCLGNVTGEALQHAQGVLEPVQRDTWTTSGTPGGIGWSWIISARRTTPSQQRRQRLPVNQLHDQKGGRLRPIRRRDLAVVKDGGDPGMGHRGGIAGLGPQAPDEAGVLGVFVAEQLDRHRPAQDLVDRLPDLTHATGRQPPAQPVAAGEIAVGDSQDHGGQLSARWQPQPSAGRRRARHPVPGSFPASTGGLAPAARPHQ
jgi:hypothetical protein